MKYNVLHMPEYAIILFGFFLAAVLIHLTFRLRVYDSVKQAIFIHILWLVVGIIWDQYAIWRGTWFYNPRLLLGEWIGHMPLEDYMFALIFPYAMFVSFAFMKKKLK